MSSDYNPPSDPLDIIHADHELISVNKPSGLLSVPGKGEHLADCSDHPCASRLPWRASRASAGSGHIGCDDLRRHAPRTAALGSSV